MLISEAYAQNAPAGPGLMDPQMLVLVFMFVAMFFLIIRAADEALERAEADGGFAAKGDEVVTAGGTLGRIAKVGDHTSTSRSRPTSRSRCRNRRSRWLCPRAP
jgi:preprotein translocase subunit YajC